jgi:hypothetical protein
MPKDKDWTKTMRGRQLLAPGDIIDVMENDAAVKARVLSCLALEDGGCLASLEILEGERQGQRVETKLRASSDKEP